MVEFVARKLGFPSFSGRLVCCGVNLVIRYFKQILIVGGVEANVHCCGEALLVRRLVDVSEAIRSRI